MMNEKIKKIKLTKSHATRLKSMNKTVPMWSQRATIRSICSYHLMKLCSLIIKKSQK